MTSRHDNPYFTEEIDPQELEERTDRLAELSRQILTELGEDADRDGLQETPVRVAKALQALTRGYHQDPKAVLRAATFEDDYSQMVIVKDIEFYSLCEHHMLPFFGKVHIAYIPNGHITGLSKLARIVDIFSRRLQVQERLTRQIKDCIEEALHPLGVMVVIEARHLCMQMRGCRSRMRSRRRATSAALLSGRAPGQSSSS